jgi:hypothetical protein
VTRIWTGIWLRLALSVLALALAVPSHAEQKNPDNLNCDGEPIAEHQFQPQSGDVVAARHLEFIRPFSGQGKLRVSICNADLHVRTNPSAKEMRLMVHMDSQPGGHPAADYVHIFRIDPDDGVIHLKFAEDAHASVTLVVPMSTGSENEFNLGRGDLIFDAIGSGGERQFNVGMGHMKLLVDGDKSYSGMEVNIGMGSLHDHRQGGQDGHFVVSRNYSGSGDGSLEINVGMGSLDIVPE